MAVRHRPQRRARRASSARAGGHAASPSPRPARLRLEDDADVALRRTAVRDALAALPARERELVALKFHAGLTNAELAQRARRERVKCRHDAAPHDAEAEEGLRCDGLTTPPSTPRSPHSWTRSMPRLPASRSIRSTPSWPSWRCCSPPTGRRSAPLSRARSIRAWRGGSRVPRRRRIRGWAGLADRAAPGRRGAHAGRGSGRWPGWHGRGGRCGGGCGDRDRGRKSVDPDRRGHARPAAPRAPARQRRRRLRLGRRRRSGVPSGLPSAPHRSAGGELRSASEPGTRSGSRGAEPRLRAVRYATTAPQRPQDRPVRAACPERRRRPASTQWRRSCST